LGRWRWGGAVLGASLGLAVPAGAASRLSDEPIPLDQTIARPRSVLEVGEPFLNTGPLTRGFRLPGGAVVQPSLLLFGTYRTAVQTFDDGSSRRSEWANRLDAFANLQLTGTERILFGLRPFDQNVRYYGYEFDPEKDYVGTTDYNINMLFFEGDIGEMFPDLDPRDAYSLDYGFSVGRQPLLMQDGMLLDDRIDSVGIVRHSLHTPWTSGLRLNAFYGWGDVHRSDNVRDSTADLFAAEAVADFWWTTVELNGAYVNSTENRSDGVYGGLGAIQRVKALGRTFNSTVRVMGSYALEHETPQTRDGVLLFGELAYTPHGTLDYVYLNSFWGIEHFSSAARAEEIGGPLGRVGILFEAFDLGRYGAPLGNEVGESAGAAVGYQRFFSAFRRQVIVELGGRKETAGPDRGTIAVGGRFQQAVGSHVILQVDSFVGARQNRTPPYGARGEVVVKF
jgi:hypothetical protein